MNERLKEIRLEFNESQRIFCKRFNMSQQTYANYESGRTALPNSLLVSLSKMDININWLITGFGSMFMKEGQEYLSPDNLEIKQEQTVLIPMTNLKLSAGNGIDWGDGIFTGELLPVPKKVVKRYSAKNLAGAEVKGDSMEPTLKDGELVIFSRGLIIDDGIYVISIQNELYVKRLSIDKLANTLTIISDNQKYPNKTYAFDIEGLEILGKVLFWIHEE